MRRCPAAHCKDWTADWWAAGGASTLTNLEKKRCLGDQELEVRFGPLTTSPQRWYNFVNPSTLRKLGVPFVFPGDEPTCRVRFEEPLTVTSEIASCLLDLEVEDIRNLEVRPIEQNQVATDHECA
jgi:hypothetical protein